MKLQVGFWGRDFSTGPNRLRITVCTVLILGPVVMSQCTDFSPPPRYLKSVFWSLWSYALLLESDILCLLWRFLLWLQDGRTLLVSSNLIISIPEAFKASFPITETDHIAERHCFNMDAAYTKGRKETFTNTEKMKTCFLLSVLKIHGMWCLCLFFLRDLVSKE